MSKRVNFLFHLGVYGVLLTGIAWQGMELLRSTRDPGVISDLKSFHVRVDGNVRRPGVYSVPEGTTQFEILKVAGIRPTSDISQFILSNQIEENSALNIGTLDEPVQLAQAQAARLEFFFGEISVIASDGRSAPSYEGLTIATGDRVLTEASSQAEISLGTNSRVDIDNFSELVFDKIGITQNNRKVTELFQRSGACWYKIVYQKTKDEMFKSITHSAEVTVGGSGADFLIEVQNDQVQINLIDGLLLVERPDGNEALNMISGQSITVFRDGRPFQVTRLTPDINVHERFSQLSREKMSYMSRSMPLNLLFCGTPAVFYAISVQFEKSEVHSVRIPAELLIEQFAQGISTLDQAFLYGGPVFASTFIERILNIRIPKFCVFDKDDLIRTANSIGGVSAPLDQKAATHLNLSKGSHKISGKQLAIYLSPAISGTEDAANRQSDILKSVYDELRSKNITLTLLLADQILGNAETNFSASEMMEQYAKFNTRSNWTYKEHTLPTRKEKRGKRACRDPIIEECVKLLNASQ